MITRDFSHQFFIIFCIIVRFSKIENRISLTRDTRCMFCVIITENTVEQSPKIKKTAEIKKVNDFKIITLKFIRIVHFLFFYFR